jgi:hypothetical protein
LSGSAGENATREAARRLTSPLTQAPPAMS